MKRKLIAVTSAAAVVALTASACSSSKSTGTKAPQASDKPAQIEVWLMADADNSKIKTVVDDTNARFLAATGVKAHITYKPWANHLTGVDAVLAGKKENVPAAMELGNTEFSNYVYAGAFADLTDKKSTFENSDSWLKGLSGPCEFNGGLYCVPYYAGTKVVIYNKDIFAKAGATVPTTIAEQKVALDKIKASQGGDAASAAFYIPGQYWYMAMSYVYGNGGSIAEPAGDGKFKANLSSATSKAGLQTWVDLVKNYSLASGNTQNENQQDTVFETGKVAQEYDASWHAGSVEQVPQNPNDPNSAKVDTAVKGKVGIYALPGVTADKPTPSFIGGENIGVPEKSAYHDLGATWIKLFTDTKAETGFIKAGWLPNATALLPAAEAEPDLKVGAGALKATWFPPASPNWATVESSNILQNMLQDIVTGKASIDDATAKADKAINAAIGG